jgi:tRNA threonylcarbamoyladenosine biosynthesis protein TsaB
MILAIRTSSGRHGVGLLDDRAQVIASREAQGTSLRGDSVADLFAAVLKETGAERGQISSVLVDLGPGGLSSTRAGISFANAFAFGRAIELKGVCSLELQLVEARLQTQLPVLSMRPAPGRQALWALYQQGQPVAVGCDAPVEAIARQRAQFDSFAVAGPLGRFALDDISLEGIALIDIDPPRIESFAQVAHRAARMQDGLALLEPINAPAGLIEGGPRDA